jgi:hypothetical protein
LASGEAVRAAVAAVGAGAEGARRAGRLALDGATSRGGLRRGATVARSPIGDGPGPAQMARATRRE